MNPFYDPYGNMDPVLRRQYMAQTYYDFSLPWNFGFNYTVNYSISRGNYPPKGYKKNITQTIGFNGQRQSDAEDGRHVPRRLRHQAKQADDLVGLHFARPALLADVLFMDSVRLPPQLEFQHRRQGGVALRPQIRQESEYVRQYVLNVQKPPPVRKMETPCRGRAFPYIIGCPHNRDCPCGAKFSGLQVLCGRCSSDSGTAACRAP